jgi:N-acetylglucosaminyldiphosphoundecaprenol N-acetyl-beta-D-mannosaminyltransferase
MNINILNFDIFCGNIEEINFNRKVVVNTINPHSYIVSKKDSHFRASLLNSEYLLPDGIGFVLAALVLKKKLIKRITGATIHEYFLGLANKKKLKVFYLGSTDECLNKIKIKIKKNYSNVETDTFSPPFMDDFDDSTNKLILKKINDFKPDILFIGMTAPKQEKWVYNHYKNIKCNIFCSIGAVFDFYSEKVPRAPKFFIALGLEWLYRSLLSRRLAKRNFSSNPKFIIDLLISYFKK